ncbi:uncharacterized protein LOC111012228 [Momordica charantia]|uniref:Uncharacterized protein LOC111012228 n=1 Tax=Momordica charantia TaxID=3673 RepID=A0A6J1CLC8_MOMCH|nr:uncharacterized protein LOC111012228 [Momordica charantia]
MGLAIVYPNLKGGEKMSLMLLSTLTLMKSIRGFHRFYSLSYHCGTLFSIPSLTKNWKDHWSLVGDRRLVSDGSVVGCVASCFRDNIFPGGAPLVVSRSENVLKKILAIPMIERVPTLLITDDRLANHRLVRDHNGPTRGNDKRLTPLEASVGKTASLSSLFSCGLLKFVGTSV